MSRGQTLSLAALLLAAAMGTAQAQQSGPVTLEEGGLMLRPSDPPAAAFFDWSWTGPGKDGADDAPFVLRHFTPRDSGTALGFDGRTGGSAAGAGLDYRAGRIAGQDIAFTIGAGVASRDTATSGFSESPAGGSGGLSGRVRISRVSLGSAVAGTLASRAAGEAPGKIAGGYDLDLSYSFDAGSLSLQRSAGSGDRIVAPWPDRGHETTAVSGRYLAGPGLDMTAWLGFSGADRPGAVQSEFNGWALLTGLRLSF